MNPIISTPAYIQDLGISYLSIQQEEEARKDLSKVQQDREDVILTKDDKEFIAGIMYDSSR